MTSWDGKDRRKCYGEDHDLLIKIDSNLTNFIKSFDNHLKDDNTNFSLHDARIKAVEKAVWIGFGIILVIEVVIKVLK